MAATELNAFISEHNNLVEQALDRWLPAATQEPALIHQAMRYSLFAGGKRLRPILVLAAAQAVGGHREQVLPAACALEMIHTYSLIHDDLPAMDNDDLRRGMLTNHKVFGEATAILAGDALLTCAFELFAERALEVGVSAHTVVQVIKEIACASGTAGMIGGQVLDLAAEGKKVTPEQLAHIHNYKTGALLRASVRVGALISGASSVQLEFLTQYAECLGLAFQIKDDILDIEGDSVTLGKPAGSDLANQKSTYPALLGLAESKRLLAEQIDLALQALHHFGSQRSVLAELAVFVRDRES
ncbi:MAG: polyprenyl synthetase family protein [Peptococcaceae bacterium]|nr:polyprenyl synthetase family protein [Peptococcaceae bacterium]